MSTPGMGRGRGAVTGKGGRGGGAHAVAQQHLTAAARENEARGAARTVSSGFKNKLCASWSGAKVSQVFGAFRGISRKLLIEFEIF